MCRLGPEPVARLPTMYENCTVVAPQFLANIAIRAMFLEASSVWGDSAASLVEDESGPVVDLFFPCAGDDPLSGCRGPHCWGNNRA
jgi:hypothetical protein